MAQKLLTREEILQAPDIPEEYVEVPEWGGTLKLRGMTASQRDKFDASLLDQKGKQITMYLVDARAKLASLCIVDEDNKRIFSETDIKALGDKSALALDRIYSVAQKLSGISDADLEELEKNSGIAQNDDSPSD